MRRSVERGTPYGTERWQKQTAKRLDLDPIRPAEPHEAKRGGELFGVKQFRGFPKFHGGTGIDQRVEV